MKITCGTLTYGLKDQKERKLIDMMDKELYDNLELERVYSYLRERGWKDIKFKDKFTTVFEKEHDAEIYQLILPNDKNLIDFNLSFKRFITKLAQYEGRTYESVYQDLVLPVSDIIRVAIKNSDTSSGSILLDDGFEEEQGK